MTVMNEIDTKESTRIIKSDTRGRASYTREFKAEVVEQCNKSGMSVLAFSRHCGVNYATLQSWIKKNDSSSRGSRQADKSPGFVLAELADGSVSGTVAIELPGGARASASDEHGVRLLAVLIRELAR
jgi:transposase-like protein